LQIWPLALLVALAAPASIWAACPGDAGERLPAPEKLQALEDTLASLASECGRHAGYLAYRGAVLNALGRHEQAALLLEQALLFDPARAGAQIDYAEALAALGDAASAAALLRDVAARPDVPPALRPQLALRLSAVEALQRLDALAAMQPGAPASLAQGWHAGWQSSGTLALKLGRDGNLNSAPARDALTLTLPDGDAVVQLADRFRPRAGSVARIEGSGQWVRPLAGGSALQFYADARARASPSASDTSYQQIQAGGAWSWPLATDAGGLATLGASTNQLRYGGAELYRALRLSASRDWYLIGRGGDCRPSLGLEGEARRYPSAAELEGRFLGLSAGLACNLGVDRVVLAARRGADTAQADRPGGNQRQFDLRLVWSRPLAGGRLGADLLWYRQRDESGYSPLLDNGAARRVERATLNLEYSYPLAMAPGWALLGSVERLAQRSNLDLFDISGSAFYLGLRWTAGRQ